MNAPVITKEISIKSGIEELGIFEKHNDAWVSSRNIAKLFGKEHKNVLQDINEKVLPFVSKEYTELNFQRSKYKDKSGKSNPQYLLNRKSFTLVVMGYTGKKAMDFKVSYIEAFEANMINEIILGMKAKDFKAVNLIDDNGHTRDAIVQEKLEQLDKAQRLNAQLITAGMSFDQRKSIIKKNYGR